MIAVYFMLYGCQTAIHEKNQYNIIRQWGAADLDLPNKISSHQSENIKSSRIDRYP